MDPASRPPFALLLPVGLALFPLNAAMLMVGPVWGPLARDLGLSDWVAGLVMAATPLCWMIVSPLVGRWSDRHGRRGFLIAGVMAGIASQALFSGSLYLGLAEGAAPWMLAGLFASRGLLGLAGGAVTVAGFALTADVTTPAQRTAATATLGGIIGMGALGGPALAAGAAGLGTEALLLALCALPVLGIPACLWIPKSRPPGASDTQRIGLLDPRLRAILAVVLFGTIALAAAELLLGFVFADLTGQGVDGAGPLSGLALLFAGLAAAVVQILLARFPVGPRLLLISGCALTALAFGVVSLATSTVFIWAAGAIAGAGLGLAMTGWTSGASLAVDDAEQAQAAAAVQVVTSIAYMIGPILAGVTYGLWAPLPWLLVVPMLVLGAALSAWSPTIRTAQRRHLARGAIGSDSSP